MCDGTLDWLAGGGGGRITVGANGCTNNKIPYSKTNPTRKYKGYGMSEASRGALSHWIVIKKKKIIRYQCVVPTTWNANPRDVAGYCGPAEGSLQGKFLDAAGYTPEALWIANPNQPIEAIRTTHSYDFCIACAVHLITPEGKVKKVDVPALPG
jgi:hydrogenase large subunit